MTVPERRAVLCGAALRVVTERGLRGLTHRAVDRQANLPEGTTSAYYRTRSALQSALAGFVNDQLSRDVSALADDLAAYDLGDQQVVTLIAQRFADWLRDGRLILARIELALEATRDESLAATLLEGRHRVVALVADVLVGHRVSTSDEAPARAEVMVAAYDGVLLAALLKPPADRASFFDLAVADLLSPLGHAE